MTSLNTLCLVGVLLTAQPWTVNHGVRSISRHSGPFCQYVHHSANQGCDRHGRTRPLSVQPPPLKIQSSNLLGWRWSPHWVVAGWTVHWFCLKALRTNRASAPLSRQKISFISIPPIPMYSYSFYRRQTYKFYYFFETVPLKSACMISRKATLYRRMILNGIVVKWLSLQ